MSKEKSSSNVSGNSGGGAGAEGHLASGSKNSAATFWDTDFVGTWEMGRDLIREFVNKQNRNRSISESSTAQFVNVQDIIRIDEPIKKNPYNVMDTRNTESLSHINSTIKTPYTHHPFDPATSIHTLKIQKSTLNDDTADFHKSADIFATTPPSCDEQFSISSTNDVLLIDPKYIKCTTPDRFMSMSEIDTTSSKIGAPRRLYQREVSNESLNLTAEAIEARRFAMFEAKFKLSNMKALWSIADSANPIQEPTPQNPNVQSFWLNYHKHRYTFEPVTETQSLFEISPVVAPDPTVNVSSTPQTNIFDRKCEQTFNMQSGTATTENPQQKKPRNIGAGIDLTDSIWSENAVTYSNENDESFYTRPQSKLWPSIAATSDISNSSGVSFNRIFLYFFFLFLVHF